MLHFVAVDLRRHPGRTLLTASGVAIGVAMIVALLSLSAGIERSASGLLHLGGSDLGLFQGGVGELTASSLPQSLVPRVRVQPEVADAASIAVATGTLPALGSFLVFGVDPRSFVMRRLVFVAGRRPARAGEAAAGEGAARQLGLHVGGALALQGRTYRVVGIYHTGAAFEDQGAVMPLAVVERLLGRPGDATTIAVELRSGADPQQVGARLERAFPGTSAISQPGQVARVDTNTLLIRKAAVVFVALALVIGGIAVMNTMLMAVFERQRDFALLLAIGWPRRLVGELVLREGIVLSLVGALAGLALGAVAVAVVVRALGASTLVVPHLTAWTLVRALLVALAMGALGSVYPAWRVTRLRPAEALG